MNLDQHCFYCSLPSSRLLKHFFSFQGIQLPCSSFTLLLQCNNLLIVFPNNALEVHNLGVVFKLVFSRSLFHLINLQFSPQTPLNTRLFNSRKMPFNSSSFGDIKRKVYLNLLILQEICLNAINKLTKSQQKPQCMSGTTTLITGGNAGIGRATAEELVRRGSNVVIACRNPLTAEETALELRRLDPYFDTLGTVEIAEVDLASLESVRSLVSTISSRKKPFDYIVASAGIMTRPLVLETGDGFEKQFQVNYLSHFLLVHELLQRSKHKYGRTGQKPPRCVFLSSVTHLGATLEKDQVNGLQKNINYNNHSTCFANSKLCQLLAAKEFNRRMNDNSGEFPVGAALACHPGLVDTEMARKFFKDKVPKVLLPIVSLFFDKIFFPFFLKTPKAATECVLFAATAPANEVGGKYVEECAVVRSSGASNDVVLASRLWEKSKELAGLK